MASISLKAVSKSYGNLEIISQLDLDIENQQFCVLVGPSGCGKSTLLRMIAGLEDVSSGSISMDGEDVTNKRPGERDLAMVFQSYALYPHKTVHDNLGFSLRMHGVDKLEAEQRITRIADTLGLAALLERFPRQLSGGQRQRVAMGRAMVRNPGVFLFDEPLSNLDAKLRVKMRTEIRDLHQRIGATTVYVTHDQIEAMTMADNIIVMNGGRIEQAGAPLELFDNPANLFVAGFLGSPSINLIDARVDNNTEALVACLPDGSNMTLSNSPGLTVGQDIVLGIRPHYLRLDEQGPLNATVKVIEPTGVETIVSADLSGIEIVSQLPRQSLPSRDEHIRFDADPDKILIFDKKSGLRM